ncbi:MAG: arabinan endo-1,5-alpha-L-arabinosidase [Myxococcota bacterium]|nr:arabinan endo-1,5-alpha-L-arabinosidase [Myxococcota bacterium]
MGRFFSLLLPSLFAALGISCGEETLECEVNENVVNLNSGSSPIHDPAIIKAEGTYYVYSSSDLASFYTSRDLHEWVLAGQVFDEIPRWLRDEIPGAHHIGSPDISYYRGRYLLFYQSHKSATCDAATGLATNATLDPTHPEYKWIDHGLILRSKPYFSSIEVICGNDQSTFNAIDPHFFEDVDGKPWLAIGSTIGGIQLVELDPETLRPLAGRDHVTLAQRFLLLDDPVIEGAYIVLRNGYYYLFMSFNHCCKGGETRYQVRVGRAKELAGPYYDKAGWPLKWGGGTLVIDGDGPLIGTGHNDVLSDEGVDWLVHHAKHSEQDFRAFLNIRKIEWSEDAWPSVCRNQIEPSL